jgi:hypothetical protein
MPCGGSGRAQLDLDNVRQAGRQDAQRPHDPFDDLYDQGLLASARADNHCQ